MNWKRRIKERTEGRREKRKAKVKEKLIFWLSYRVKRYGGILGEQMKGWQWMIFWVADDKVVDIVLSKILLRKRDFDTCSKVSMMENHDLTKNDEK